MTDEEHEAEVMKAAAEVTAEFLSEDMEWTFVLKENAVVGNLIALTPGRTPATESMYVRDERVDGVIVEVTSQKLGDLVLVGFLREGQQMKKQTVWHGRPPYIPFDTSSS